MGYIGVDKVGCVYFRVVINQFICSTFDTFDHSWICINKKFRPTNLGSLRKANGVISGIIV